MEKILKNEEEDLVTPVKRHQKKQKTNVSWNELPFAEESPELDLEGSVQRALRRLRKSSATARTLDIRQLRPAKGWTSWDPSGKRKKKKKKKSLSSSPSSVSKKTDI